MPPKNKTTYQLVKELPSGTTIQVFKQQYKLGKSFATGGFGRIYFAKKVTS